ncbi:raffinose/stachyose/melibiose transport system permease protein [Gracilibacillus orientalis]|uniref:Raffinose/stachyose/melibiose transport system permease protein n=1 Tax=Gracilibacillus orientalis TaxID=334253 RepID=A0A1I4HYR6_9BACI|nr:carbohydrate ABC transporter permease [Gracilibacillus orientalis]SFL46903.1 raffinose/stachyose/melibiose transport system permease protein [Gracilibacillus orientalis]
MQQDIRVENKSTYQSPFFTKRGIGSVLRIIFLLVFSFLMIYPLYWLMISGFKSNEEFFASPYALPQEWTFQNFIEAWQIADLGTAMINSTIVTVGGTLLTVFIGALTAYVLSRFDFRLKGLVMVFFVIGMLIPVHSTLVPLFTMMNKVDMLNTYWALILPYTAFELPIAIFLITAYMSSIPKEIEEASVIDGAGYWGIFFRMMLPMSIPAMATVAILAFLRYWNEYVFALVFINDSSLKTLPLSLSIFSDGYSTNYSLTMAAMAIAVIPTIIMYVFFQEQIMKGMVAGSVKG